MTPKDRTGRSGPISRRAALRTVAAVPALLAGAAATAHWKRAYAQSKKSLRVWSTQSVGAQVDAWKRTVAAFEQANPGIAVAFEPVGINDIAPKLTTALAGGEPPDMVAGSNTELPAGMHQEGLIAEISDVVKAVGDFSPTMLSVYNDKGYQFAVGLAQTVISCGWYRADLLQQAGLNQPPATWEELIPAAEKTTKGAVSGLALPYIKNLFTSIVFDVFLRQAKGDILAPDGSIVFNNQGTERALELLKTLRPFCPAGANNYNFLEVVNAFVAGQAAMTMYTGRALATVAQQNPSIDASVKAFRFPIPKDGVSYYQCGYDAVYVIKHPKVATAEAKLFAAFIYKPEPYIDFLLTVPSHLLPVTKSAAESPAYTSHPILQNHKQDVATMLGVARDAFPAIRPTAKHPFQPEIGKIYASNVMAECVQKVVINNEPIKASVAWCQDQIAKVIKT